MGGHGRRLDATVVPGPTRGLARPSRPCSLRPAIKLVGHYDLLMTRQSTPVNHRTLGHYPAICLQHAARLIDSKAGVSSIVRSAGTTRLSLSTAWWRHRPE